MLDHPRGPDILDAVARLLRDTLIPQLPPSAVFQARVAANAVDLVARELRLAPAAEAQALQRLRALSGAGDDDGAGGADDADDADSALHAPCDADPTRALAALETALAARIRQGEITDQAPGLLDHLWASTLAKLAIDQPSYAPYQRELARRAAPTDTDPQPKE
jgi:hypothetical protein